MINYSIPEFSNNDEVRNIWRQKIKETGDYPAYVFLIDPSKTVISSICEDYIFSESQLSIFERKSILLNALDRPRDFDENVHKNGHLLKRGLDNIDKRKIEGIIQLLLATHTHGKFYKNILQSLDILNEFIPEKIEGYRKFIGNQESYPK